MWKKEVLSFPFFFDGQTETVIKGVNKKGAAPYRFERSSLQKYFQKQHFVKILNHFLISSFCCKSKPGFLPKWNQTSSKHPLDVSKRKYIFWLLKNKAIKNPTYRIIGLEMGLNEMTEMRVILQPFVMLFIRESFIPAKPRRRNCDKDMGRVYRGGKKLPVVRIEVSRYGGRSKASFLGFGRNRARITVRVHRWWIASNLLLRWSP